MATATEKGGGFPARGPDGLECSFCATFHFGKNQIAIERGRSGNTPLTNGAGGGGGGMMFIRASLITTPRSRFIRRIPYSGHSCITRTATTHIVFGVQKQRQSRSPSPDYCAKPHGPL